MSDNSSGTNSWTFLTSEVKEPVVESVGLLARGDASSLGSPQLQTEQLGPDLPQAPDPPDSQAEQTHGPEPPQVAPLESGDDAAVLHATILKADPGPSGDPHVENLSSLTSDPDDRTPSDHGKDDLASDAHVFSDACAPPSPCPGPASAPDGVKEAEECLREGKELKRTLHEDFTPGFESLEEEENEGSGVRRRNISLLPTQHHDDEEDMEEEHPYSPPREDCFGFSLNKCIFGALVLLGLGTIFFSAGEADMGELKDPELQKAWLNSEAPIHEPVQPSEVMERLAKDGEQIAKLQAQLQQQEEKLKVQEAEGSKERMRREELEMQNQRMKEELEKLPALQKQLEQETQKVKSERAEEDLQGLPAMQKALEFLRVKIAELPQNTVPVAHSAEHKREKATNQGEKESKNKWHGKDAKEKRNEWKKGSRGAAEVEKPWMGKDGEDGDGKKKGAWRKQKVEQEEGKGERKAEQDGARGKGPNDGGKWKDGGEKRKFRQDGDKGDWRYDPKSKRAEQKTSDSGREEPKERKSSGAKAKEKERGSEQKDWNHGKKWKVEQAGGNEQKEWKGRRGEKRAWNEGKEQEEGHERGGGGKDKTKSDGKREQAQKEKSRKGEKDHHKGTGEKKVGKGQEEKRWSGRERDLSKDDASETWKDVKKAKEERHERGEKCGGKAKPGCDSLDPHQARQTHSNQRNSKDHMQDNYWSRQKERIHHYHGSTEECTGVAECAYAEGLSPVPQSDFEALMLGFLTRVLGPEEQMSKKEELNKLIGEFFINGVFIHDQIPFGEFVEDVADILEDLAEEEGDEEMEDEMEGFAREALEKFALPDSIGNEEKSKGGSG